MYDTSNPYNWKYYKTAIYPYGRWTITDASLSPDNKFLAYSSIRSIVCLASTDPTLSDDSPLFMDFADTGGQDRYNQFAGYSGFGVSDTPLQIHGVNRQLRRNRFGLSDSRVMVVRLSQGLQQILYTCMISRQRSRCFG